MPKIDITTPPPSVPVLGIDHIELRLKNASKSARIFCEVWGAQEWAYANKTTGRIYADSEVIILGGVPFILTDPIRKDSRVAQDIKLHGEGVHDVAFGVRDAVTAYDTTLRLGAISAAKPRVFFDRSPPLGDAEVIMGHAAIEACGPVVHTLIDRHNYPKYEFAPGFYPAARGRFPHGNDVGLSGIDHITFNVWTGQMEDWAAFYKRVFGFVEVARFSEAEISTDQAALRSIVLRSPNGSITFAINEPLEGRGGHIGDFLRDRRGPGVQHIAFATHDIVQTVRALMERGVQFRRVPDTYYEAAYDRLLAGAPTWPRDELHDLIERLRPLGILIDQDAGGILLQIFTEVIIGEGEGLFFEIIQRIGATGFGQGQLQGFV